MMINQTFSFCQIVYQKLSHIQVFDVRYNLPKVEAVREIFFSTMVLQIYYVTSVVPTLWFILRSRFSLDPLYSQANWYNDTGQLG